MHLSIIIKCNVNILQKKKMQRKYFFFELKCNVNIRTPFLFFFFKENIQTP